jgi:hypothetical protein
VARGVSQLFTPIALHDVTIRDRVWGRPDVPVLRRRRPPERVAPRAHRLVRPRRRPGWCSPKRPRSSPRTGSRLRSPSPGRTSGRTVAIVSFVRGQVSAAPASTGPREPFVLDGDVLGTRERGLAVDVEVNRESSWDPATHQRTLAPPRRHHPRPRRRRPATRRPDPRQTRRPAHHRVLRPRPRSPRPPRRPLPHRLRPCRLDEGGAGRREARSTRNDDR